MLSEESHTSAILNWLIKWLYLGAPVPHMCVTDWSRALLNAVTRAFTNFKSIDDYADSLHGEDAPAHIYIRLDVAHTFKKHSSYLRAMRKRVKIFYLSCIGQLINMY